MTAAHRWAIVLCGLAVFFDGYDAQMLALAIPLLAKEFNVVPTAFAMAASGSLAGMALGAMLISPLADRFGRRPLLIASLLLFSIPTLIAMHAHTPFTMAIWRVVAGAGLGSTVPVTIAVTADLAPSHRRVAIVTLMASGFAVGASTAGQIAPFLVQAWGWHGLFGFGGFLPLVLALLCLRGIPATASRGLRQAPTSALAAVPRLFARGLRGRTFALWALNAINLFANYGLASWLPTLLVQNGWTLAGASRATGVLAIGAVTGSYLASTLMDRGRLVLGLAGAYAIAATALMLCGTNPGSTVIWVLLLIVLGFGAIGAQLTLGPLASTCYPDILRTTGVGWANGFGRAGSLFGPLALAWLMNQHLAPTRVLGALMIPMLLCLVVATILPWTLRTPLASMASPVSTPAAPRP